MSTTAKCTSCPNKTACKVAPYYGQARVTASDKCMCTWPRWGAYGGYGSQQTQGWGCQKCMTCVPPYVPTNLAPCVSSPYPTLSKFRIGWPPKFRIPMKSCRPGSWQASQQLEALAPVTY